MLADGQDLGQVTTIPAGALAFDLEAAFETGFIFEQIQRQMSNGGEVLRGVALAHPAIVLAKGHIQTPMQLILNGPMRANRLGEDLGVGLDRGDEIAPLGGDLVAFVEPIKLSV